MKTKRHRAIIKSKGFKKQRNPYYKWEADNLIFTNLAYEKFWN